MQAGSSSPVEQREYVREGVEEYGSKADEGSVTSVAADRPSGAGRSVDG